MDPFHFRYYRYDENAPPYTEDELRALAQQDSVVTARLLATVALYKAQRDELRDSARQILDEFVDPKDQNRPAVHRLRDMINRAPWPR